MNVIGHQTISPDLKLELAAIAHQRPEVVFSIRITEENVSPVIAALGHVMRKTNRNRSCDPWHKLSVLEIGQKSNGNTGSVPVFQLQIEVTWACPGFLFAEITALRTLT